MKDVLRVVSSVVLRLLRLFEGCFEVVLRLFEGCFEVFEVVFVLSVVLRLF